MEAELETFVKAHQTQLQTSGVPPLYWTSLFIKLKQGVFDAGHSFSFEKTQGAEGDTPCAWKVVVSADDGIKASDPINIYIVDHAWTYRMDTARQQLETIPGFLERMTNLMNITQGDKTNDELIEEVLNESWKFSQFYKVAGAELGSKDSLPIWYIMDEFGSRIQHSEDPSFACAPFFYSDQQISYSLIWPLHDLEEGDEVTRDYIYGLNKTDQAQRNIRLLPWFPKDFSSVNFEQEDPGESFFNSFRVKESLPDEDLCQPPDVTSDRILKIYTDEVLVEEFVTDAKFQIVDSMHEADIIWFQKAIKNYREIFEAKPTAQINQFPCEMVLNCKDLLPLVARRVAPPSGPKWLATTYNLKTELDKFVAYYQHREKLGLDNTWICKTWNLARSFDMQVTDNLNYILRLSDTGPKVAVKYIHDGVLFDRPGVGLVKFDLRYNILVSSLKPLKLYTQKVFWLRVANKPFSLDHFDDFEKHFTVMNYGDEELCQVHSPDFVEKMKRQYPDLCWEEVEGRIFSAFVDLFTAAASKDPPMGMKHVNNCRGFYGLDVMLTWETNEKGEKYMQPIVLEVNLAGDNKRCLTYHPNFYNETFRLLFCGEENEAIFKDISAYS